MGKELVAHVILKSLVNASTTSLYTFDSRNSHYYAQVYPQILWINIFVIKNKLHKITVMK